MNTFKSKLLILILLIIGINVCTSNRAWAVNCRVGTPNYATIQSALDEVACSRVLIPAGRYTEHLSISRSVEVIGSGVNRTILSGNNTDLVISIQGRAYPPTVVISRLTIQEGYQQTGGYSSAGAGVSCISGPGVIPNPTTLLLSNVLIKNNRLYDGAGSGVYVDGCDITIQDSTVRDNSFVFNNNGFPARGAGLVVYESDHVVINNSKFINNSIPTVNAVIKEGAGIHFDGVQNVQINGSTFRGNQSTESGGALSIANSSVNINQCVFENNQASGAGGAISISWQNGRIPAVSIITVTDSSFIENSASYGGAIMMNLLIPNRNYSVNITDSNFGRNSASIAGGAIQLQGMLYNPPSMPLNLNVDSSIFSQNNAPHGGAIYSNSYSNYEVTISNSKIDRNHQTEGAALEINNSVYHIMNSSITRNETTGASAGGISIERNQCGFPCGFMLTNPTLDITNSTLALNSGGHGGALLVSNDAEVELLHDTIVHNTSPDVSGILNDNPATPVNVSNSIVGFNQGGSCSSKVRQVSDFLNLSDDNTCIEPNYEFGFPDNFINIAPSLSILSNRTEGYLPVLPPQVPTNYVVDSGYQLPTAVDQQGNPRPQDYQCDKDTNPDLGAIELQFNCN